MIEPLIGGRADANRGERRARGSELARRRTVARIVDCQRPSTRASLALGAAQDERRGSGLDRASPDERRGRGLDSARGWARVLALVLVVLVVGAPEARADDVAACEVVRGALAKKDLARASVALGACAAADAEAAGALEGEIARRAQQAGYSPVEVVSDPPGETVIASVATELPFVAPASLWLPPGTHELVLVVDGAPVASSLVIVKDGNRAAALLTRPGAAPPPGTSEVDFSDEAAGEMQSGTPEEVEFASLLPERYRQGLAQRPDAWDGDAVGGRRAVYRAAVGVALARAGGATATGVMVEARAGYGVARPGPRVRVSPEVAVVVARAEDATGEARTLAQVHGAALVELAWLSGGRGGAVAAGPGAAWIAGPGADDARAGAALAAVATAELVLGRASVLARVELPLVTTADVRTTTLGFGVGLRW